MIFKSKFKHPVSATIINEIPAQVFMVAPVITCRDNQRPGEIAFVDKRRNGAAAGHQT